MAGDTRILTGLLERRAIEADLRGLGEITSLDLLVQRAEEIVQRGGPILPALLSLLDTADPQLRGGLGQVAARLNREEVVAALRQVARSRDRSQQARLSAVTLLDRYLHEPVDDALWADLGNADSIAVQSLRELIQEMERSPSVVIEYLDQLAAQPHEVPWLILKAVPSLQPNPHLVTLLRMLAQGDDPRLAEAALEQLGRTRTSDAVRALGSLAATLPPQRAALAERGLRKLRMSGVTVPAPTEEETGHWRALMSPVDGAGSQLIWFVKEADSQRNGVLFGVVTREPEGIIASYGSPDVPASRLPPRQPTGSVHTVPQADGGMPITLLEVPFDEGRRAVRDALEQNWATGHGTPPEYRLLNPWIWDVPGAAEVTPAMEGDALAPADEPVQELDSPPSGDAAPATAALLDHPAFASWFWRAPELDEAAAALGRRHTLAARTRQITAVTEAHFGAETIASYQRRLRQMARWLTLAQDLAAAALARAAARELTQLAPGRSPFVRRLIGHGLDIAVVIQESESDSERNA